MTTEEIKSIIDETLDAVNNTTSVTNPYRARIALYSKYGIPISEMDKMWKKCDDKIRAIRDYEGFDDSDGGVSGDNYSRHEMM